MKQFTEAYLEFRERVVSLIKELAKELGI